MNLLGRGVLVAEFVASGARWSTDRLHMGPSKDRIGEVAASPDGLLSTCTLGAVSLNTGTCFGCLCRHEQCECSVAKKARGLRSTP